MLRLSHILTTAALVAVCAAPASAATFEELIDRQTDDVRGGRRHRLPHGYQPVRRQTARARTCARPTRVDARRSRTAGHAQDCGRPTRSTQRHGRPVDGTCSTGTTARPTRSTPRGTCRRCRSPSSRRATCPSSGFDWGDAGIGAAGMLGPVQHRRRVARCCSRAAGAASARVTIAERADLRSQREGRRRRRRPSSAVRPARADGTVGSDPPERTMKAAFTPGTTFAGYRIESLVGRGGMGVVYRATDLSLERPVALKLIAPELAEDERFRSRFLREPRLAASLDHPNVIPIYEAGEHDGQLYLAMRFVEGSDLRTLLDARGQARARSGRSTILGQVAGALDAAHRRALVHRDVKPGERAPRRGRPRLPDRLRHHASSSAAPRPTPAGWWGRSTTSRPSRSAATRSTGARTATRSAACSTSAWPASRRSGARPRRRRCGRTCRRSRRRCAATRGSTRCSARRWRRTGRTATASCGELIEAAAAALGLAAPQARARAAVRRAPARPASCSSRAASSCWSRPRGAVIAALGGDDAGTPEPLGNGVAAIDGGGTQLASFTETETPPSNVAVGEGAVWVLGLEDSTVVAHRSGDEEAGEALQAAPRSDRHRRGRRRRLGQGRWQARSNRSGYGEGHQDRQAPRHSR